ncbi:MAG: transglutaminase-like domain-containing protein [Planctomycetota bacterium]|nr:transglutaminase-like domain-containing protein [Planctomycetota bacterium]
MLRLAFCFLLALVLPLCNSAKAQFESDTKTSGLRVGKTDTEKLRIGIKVTAMGGPCKGLKGSTPVPLDWPEQQVKIIDEKLSSNVRKVSYRTLGDGAKQMVIDIPSLEAGEEATAIITFEITRSSILPPENTADLKVPTKVDQDMKKYLGVSPYIETRHAKLRQLAKQTAADKEGWAMVEALYDVTREKVEYKEGKMKGALQALNDGYGDCEELTSLFIALCRNVNVPARAVWVHGHCYPEFYMVDADGNGEWYPCQAAGTRSFGGIPELRAIIQKGDSFKDPDRPKEQLRYVNEFLKGASSKGGGKPKVEFIREIVTK